MRNEFTALHLKQWAIIAAFDELSTICATGHADTQSLQTMLSRLLAYPASRKAKCFAGNHYNTVADHCVNVAENLIRLCLLGQAPALALQTVDNVLSIALGHIQTALTRYEGSH